MNPSPMLALSGLGLVTGALVGGKSRRIWLATTVGGSLAALVAAISVLIGGPEWDWRSDFSVGGEPLHLRFDAISALFVALLGLVAAAGTVYAQEYWSDKDHPRSAPAGRVWWSLMILCLGIVLLSSNGLQFLIAWEVFAVSSYFLIALDRQRLEARAAGWLYLGASHAALLCLFAYFSTIAARTGSWDLGPMRGRTDLAPLFWLALCGFGIKAGMFPLHIWLPSAHSNAPSHVSAMMSGVTIKIGIYGLVRFSGWLPVPADAGWVVAALGVASAVLGVAFALGQHDLKRLLAYHSVENIGIILIGLGFALVAVRHGDAAWGWLALAGALLHVWNHGLFKSLLFFGAGSVQRATGTREMSLLGGLWRRMPWTAGLFALGALAICGLPPLNGFVSEWLVYLGLFDALNSGGGAALASVAAVALLAVTGALALACFVKAGGITFLGAARTRAAERARECGPWMRGTMITLALACVAIGLAPVVFWTAAARAAGEWNPAWIGLGAPVPLETLGYLDVAFTSAAVLAVWLVWRRVTEIAPRRAPTWDCGYSVPTARMQYTAGSFAGSIIEWFAWVLRPVRHGRPPEQIFPIGADREEHTPETVLERVVEPVGRAIMRLALAARRLQHGRSQAYLFYIVIGLAALGAMALAGGAR